MPARLTPQTVYRRPLRRGSRLQAACQAKEGARPQVSRQRGTAANPAGPALPSWAGAGEPRHRQLAIPGASAACTQHLLGQTSAPRKGRCVQVCVHAGVRPRACVCAVGAAVLSDRDGRGGWGGAEQEGPGPSWATVPQSGWGQPWGAGSPPPAPCPPAPELCRPNGCQSFPSLSRQESVCWGQWC